MNGLNEWRLKEEAYDLETPAFAVDLCLLLGLRNAGDWCARHGPRPVGVVETGHVVSTCQSELCMRWQWALRERALFDIVANSPESRWQCSF